MLDTLKTITTGAVRIWQEEEFFCFSRFTRDQAEILRRRGFHPREESSAGMRLEFTTRGGEIAFEYMALPGSGRGYYGLEVTVDGLGVYHADYDTLPHAGSLHYAVPESEMPRRVCVYFPNLAQLRIRNLILPSDAEACPRKRNYLALGDSITQGYDALHPNQSYANLLADALDAHVLNQAIGGDVFCPENLDPALPFQPDLITVAYGTNDWATCVLKEDTVRAYLDKLTGLYPGVPVFLLLPIWRSVEEEVREGISLQQGRELIARCAEKHASIRVIDCSRFVPHLAQYFYDEVLHPNDMGFLYYAGALEQAIGKHLPQE